VIEFRILGPLEVARDGAPIALGGRRRRAALAILLLSTGRVVSVDRLADDLYAGAAPATAVTQVHRQVSELRKLLPEARIETTPPGYVLHVDPSQLDLQRFERLADEGAERLALGDLEAARNLLGDALDLWRGPPLADLADEPFAHSARARLEEVRLTVLERRLDADVALGQAGAVVPELEALVAEHPFREPLVGQLMLALYRSGRQAEALAAYRAQRTVLAERLGLEPGPSLRRLETAILRHDPGIGPQGAGPEAPLVIAVAVEQRPSPGLVDLAVRDGRDAIVLQIVAAEAALPAAAAAVAEQRLQHGRGLRAAAFVAADWSDDLVRFARSHDAALVVIDAPDDLLERLPVHVLERSTADVGLVVRGDAGIRAGPIYVLFGGGEHDWAALELASVVARALDGPLRLVGTAAAAEGRRDASRVLADASLAVQRAFAVESTPVLAPMLPDAVVAVVDDGALVVAGIGSRWRSDGLGPVHDALVANARSPVVLVHRGPRPGLLAPRESRTHFTWSLQN
jgi:DNA-binding SARP family transcriptional activator